MTTEADPRQVVHALVEAGLVDPARKGDAEGVVRSVLAPAVSAAPAPLRRRLAEIAGYVGGAFVVGAVLLFFGSTWSDLGPGAQATLLFGTAVLLVAAGVAFVVSAGGRVALLGTAEDLRRRLTSVLLTGAAASAAFGLGLLLTHRMDHDALGVMCAFLLGGLAALAGYLVAPSTVGQLGTAFSVSMVVPTGIDAANIDQRGALLSGLLLLAIGVVWLVAAERRWWHEGLSGLVIGCILVVVGGQVPILDDAAWTGYVLTALVGVLAFWRYGVTRSWPYLATGVVAVTLAVPEATNDWFGGSLGAAGILLVTGATLLVAALLGLRLRQTADDDSAHIA
jgi:hypothetical protein